MHQSCWYETEGLPSDWVIGVSENGWTTDQLGVYWLKEVFNKETLPPHASAGFDQFCSENQIIALYMPPHSSHLLQPLDVGCFSSLKTAYGQQVENQMRLGINHIDKEEFLALYPAAQIQALTESNIKSGFRAAGLVPYDPEQVLSRLNTTMHTPTPPGTSHSSQASWATATPHNIHQLEQQTKKVKGYIKRPQEGALRVEEGLDRVRRVNELEGGVVEAAGSQPRKRAAPRCSEVFRLLNYVFRSLMDYVICEVVSSRVDLQVTLNTFSSSKVWAKFPVARKVPTALADYVEKNSLQGQLKYCLFVGASSGAETENRWARNNMIERRAPHQVGKEIAKGINNGNINFFDKHLSMFPSDLGFYTKDRPNNKLDVMIIEASAITEDGGIIPGASVGASPELVQMAEKIIIEVNTAAPSFEGLHDITMCDKPPRRKPYLIMAPEDRIGTTYIPVDPEKVVAIVESDYPDRTQPNAPADAGSHAIAKHIIEFLQHEVKMGHLPNNLLPIQSGIGNIANAVIGSLSTSGSNFRNLRVWTEVLQDSFLDLFDTGHLDFATATSVRFSPDGFKRFYDNWERYFDKLLLRSQQVSNSP
ncbi:acetyl-CoA hydrolase [Histoplasma mississippiense (nom. inval.)]|uniref:acetyl-CoA hydrolase n=1 Tax=Ajellomyces capsulatus (strain NAm1 / WU24) TaxID=2059318 RepID=UPI000157BCA3|nr:acetyl-CoA hydrolase [Histoplasma mississippiense (nom. inval.)]EDN06237.1 acetyl-CoA hydrolase [Histoplasma mississippiense (nom. inval.)]